MNENLNIAEILKSVGAKEGYPLYSTLLGDCRLRSIAGDGAITVENGHVTHILQPNGRFYKYQKGECTLFPSKDNRDWSTVKPEKPECSFKPYDKVLVRDEDMDSWKCDFFSHYIYNNTPEYHYITISNCYKQCIPYEGNEHLVGTTDSPKEGGEK